MQLERFRTILNAYGAAPERWPEEERTDALALTRASVTAARELARALTLDSALEYAASAGASIGADRFAVLQARIVEAAHPLTQSWTGRWFGINLTPMQLWPSVAGLAMATLLGFAVGIGGLLQSESDHDTDDGLVFSSIDLPIGGQ